MITLKTIYKDIEVTKEQIQEYLEYYEFDNVNDLIDDVMNWDGEDVGISFEVGYLRALEGLKVYTFSYKLKSVLSKLKSKLKGKRS